MRFIKFIHCFCILSYSEILGQLQSDSLKILFNGVWVFESENHLTLSGCQSGMNMPDSVPEIAYALTIQEDSFRLSNSIEKWRLCYDVQHTFLAGAFSNYTDTINLNANNYWTQNINTGFKTEKMPINALFKFRVISVNQEVLIVEVIEWGYKFSPPLNFSFSKYKIPLIMKFTKRQSRKSADENTLKNKKN